VDLPGVFGINRLFSIKISCFICRGTKCQESVLNIFSYDIYDTLLTRIFFHPEDLFVFMDRKLKLEGIIDPSMDFKSIRLKSEEDARTKSLKEETTLDEIYSQIQKMTAMSDQTLEKIFEFELEMENFSTRPIAYSRDLVDSKSILISDIYLSEDFISKLLNKNDILFNKLFISSAYGETKDSSSLYRFVLEDIDLKKYELTHTGDNIHSDVKMARKAGINANEFIFARPTRYEKMVNNLESGDRLESLIAGTMRTSRLSEKFDSDHMQSVWDISTNVVAPVLFLYVNWILHKSMKEGIGTLFFMSRDGHILSQIAEKMVKMYEMPIRCKYLFGSRKAFHLPGVNEVSEDEINWIFDDTEHLSINSICNRIEMSCDLFMSILQLDSKIDPNRNLRRDEREIIRTLFESNPDIHDIIIETAEIKRQIVGSYLKQEGFNVASKFGIVDVGWRARQQRSLSMILDQCGLYPEKGIHGFYLSLVDPVDGYKQDQQHSYLNYHDNKELFDYHSIYELFVAADHGSCVGFEEHNGKVKPILRDQINSAILGWGLSTHQRGIRLFADELLAAQSFLDIENFIPRFDISKLILKEFLMFPTRNEAKCYGYLEIYEDQEEEVSYTLARKLKTSSLVMALVQPTQVFNDNSWREASFALSLTHARMYQGLFHQAKRIKAKISKIFKSV